MKKVGILTLPISENYGGILQCYALQEAVKDLGYSPHIMSIGKRNSFRFKQIIKDILRLIPFQDFNNYRSTEKRKKILKGFIDSKFHNKSLLLTGDQALSDYTANNDLFSIIVGSDQVWRYKYTKEYYPNYFLNFKLHGDVKKIAYAASFGTNRWQEDLLCSEVERYLENFNSVSVREVDGVEICMKKFNYLNAKHVCDPVFLHKKDKYEIICEKVKKERKSVSIYVLDDKKTAVDIGKNLINSFNIDNSELSFFGHKKSLGGNDDTIEQWVANFRDSDFIVTDSFHGMMFSIIFRKSFIVLANKSRGISRFESVLSLFGLQERMIYDSEIGDLNLKIDYSKIEDDINLFVRESKAFLKGSLES
jgi:hypothetical protein